MVVWLHVVCGLWVFYMSSYLVCEVGMAGVV